MASKHSELRDIFNNGISALDDAAFKAVIDQFPYNDGQPQVFVSFNEGFNDDIDQVNPEEVNNLGGIRDLPTAPVEMFISSTSAADTSISYVLEMLNEDFDLEERIVTTDGVDGTVAVSVGLVYRAFVLSSIDQSQSDSTGDIYLFESGAVIPGNGSGVHLLAPSEYDTGVAGNRSLNSNYTIPKGYTGYTLGFQLSTNASVDLDVYVQARQNVGVKTPWETFIPFGINQNSFGFIGRGRVIQELSDLRVLSKAGSPNTDNTVSFDVLLIKNDVLDQQGPLPGSQD